MKPSNPLKYPIEYFDVQVQFAYKWAQLSQTPVAEILLEKTALYLKLTDKKPTEPDLNSTWSSIVPNLDPSMPLQDFSSNFFTAYSQQNHALYKAPFYPENDGKHFGFFGYDYYPKSKLNNGKNTIKIHFSNLYRGAKSGLHPDFMPKRKQDLKKMIQYIKTTYPEAEEILGGSWLYALPQYRDTFPPQFTKNMRIIVPKEFEYLPNSVPHLSFNGDSLWGQFVDRYGWGRLEACTEFEKNIKNAHTLEQLLLSFPTLPLQPKLDFFVFCNTLNIS